MKIVIFGANGATGKILTKQALRQRPIFAQGDSHSNVLGAAQHAEVSAARGVQGAEQKLRKRKKAMTKKSQIPLYTRLGNVLTLTLMRAGVKLVGPYMFFGSYPMYLFTVRGRTSGLPRTVVLAIMERNGKRYVGSPYGIVDWVRNLRAAGEAILTRGRRAETVNARELPKDEAALVLREETRGGNPFTRFYGVNADSSLEEFERAVIIHPLFVLERK